VLPAQPARRVPHGIGFVPGAILMLKSGTPAPAGFTKLGKMKAEYRATTPQNNGADGDVDVTFDLYVKN
jgi:hypothetical protein